MRSRSLAVLTLVALLMSIAVSCNRDPGVAKRRYLESGDKYMQQGRYEEAVIRFENALNIDPKFVDAYYKLAKADAALGRWNESYTALQHAIEIDPNHADSLLALGQLYLAARDFPKAEEAARSVISHDAANAAAYQLLGAALMGEQKNDDGLAAFNKIKELRPTDPSSYVNAALVEVSMQKLDAGEADLKKAIQVDNHYWPASMDLANLYRLQGKVQQADSVLEQGIAQSPEATDLYVTRASLRWDSGDLTGANQILDQIRDRQPKSADVAAKIGDFYVGEKDLGKALSEYQRGQAIDSNNDQIKKRMIDLFLATGRIQQASQLTNDILKQNPKDNHGRVFQADIALAQGRTTEAVNMLRQVIADAPELSQAHYVLGEAYWKNGDPQQADGEFLESLKNDVNSTNTLKRLVELHMAQGDLQGARDYAVRLVQLAPADLEYRLLLASVYQRRNELSLAYEQLQIAQKLAPNDVTAHVYLAQTYAAARQWKQAEAEYDIALKQQPESSEILSAYAEYFVNRGLPGSAIALVKQHLAAYPKDAEAHVTLGTLLLNQKKNEEASAELRQGLELNPNSSTAHLRMGQLLQQQNQLQAAVNEFQAALRIQPNFPPLITLIGNLYLDQGNLAEARKYYEQALAVDPNFAIAQSNLAYVIAKTGGNLDVALGLAQAAKREMPDLDSLTDTLGWIEYQRRSYSSAVSTLNDCVQRSPDNARCRYHLGMALYQSGDNSGARQQLEAALRMNLEPEDAEQARAVLAKSH